MAAKPVAVLALVVGAILTSMILSAQAHPRKPLKFTFDKPKNSSSNELVINESVRIQLPNGTGTTGTIIKLLKIQLGPNAKMARSDKVEDNSIKILRNVIPLFSGPRIPSQPSDFADENQSVPDNSGTIGDFFPVASKVRALVEKMRAAHMNHFDVHRDHVTTKRSISNKQVNNSTSSASNLTKSPINATQTPIPLGSTYTTETAGTSTEMAPVAIKAVADKIDTNSTLNISVTDGISTLPAWIEDGTTIGQLVNSSLVSESFIDDSQLVNEVQFVDEVNETVARNVTPQTVATEAFDIKGQIIVSTSKTDDSLVSVTPETSANLQTINVTGDKFNSTESAITNKKIETIALGAIEETKSVSSKFSTETTSEHTTGWSISGITLPSSTITWPSNTSATLTPIPQQGTTMQAGEIQSDGTTSSPNSENVTTAIDNSTHTTVKQSTISGSTTPLFEDKPLDWDDL